MAEQRQIFLDILIVENDTVYRKVPYSVVTDWIQQGRLLPEDQVRVSGSENWKSLQEIPRFQPYFPTKEAERTEDSAEALEPVSASFALPTHSHGDEDEDVDMIPLIDVTLVLLIFFLMSAAVKSGILSPIKTPGAKYQLAAIDKEMFWVGIDIKDENGNQRKDENGWPVPWFSLGRGKQELEILPKDKNGQIPRAQDMTPVVKYLERELDSYRGAINIRIRAHEKLPFEIIRDQGTKELQRLQAMLNEGRRPGERIEIKVFGEVSEPQ